MALETRGMARCHAKTGLEKHNRDKAFLKIDT